MVVRMHVAKTFWLKLKLWKDLCLHLQVCGLVSTFECRKKFTKICREEDKV
jgi:hypothetical protein